MQISVVVMKATMFCLSANARLNDFLVRALPLHHQRPCNLLKNHELISCLLDCIQQQCDKRSYPYRFIIYEFEVFHYSSVIIWL